VITVFNNGYNWGYGYGYGGYGYGGLPFMGHDPNDVDRAGTAGCSTCIGGRVGCGTATYHNNRLYGSRSRPVQFTHISTMCLENGEVVDVLHADREFFNRLRYDCTECREFWAAIDCCIEFGDVRDVFLSDGKCGLIPLKTKNNGYMIHADQIQPFAGTRRLVRMTACFDKHNDHVTISTYYRRHAKCDCYESHCGCGEEGCGAGHGVAAFDGNGLVVE